MCGSGIVRTDQGEGDLIHGACCTDCRIRKTVQKQESRTGMIVRPDVNLYLPRSEIMGSKCWAKVTQKEAGKKCASC